MNSNVIDKFLIFEENNNLFEFQIGGKNIWPIIRFRVYTLIIQNTNNVHVNHPKKQIHKSIISIIKTLYLSLKKSPFLRKRKGTIIFSHPRKTINKIGVYECKYTEHLANSDAYVFDIPFQERHFRPTQTPNLVYLDLVLTISRLCGILGKLRYVKSQDKKKLRKLQLAIEQEFNIEIPSIKSLVKILSSKHRAISFLARVILNQIQPSQVIMTVAYSDVNMPFIQQAKMKGIKVIEVQHGILGKNHVAYNFMKKREFDWFPDELWVWNDFWVQKTRLPIPRKNIKIKGFPFLEKFKKNKVYSHSKKKQIVIISQGPYSEFLLDLAIKLSNKIDKNNYHIIYKPHPSELEANSPLIQHLIEKEISISTHNNIYELFNSSEYQIGVNSTALFEGLEFNLKTFIYNKYGFKTFDGVKGIIFFNSELDILYHL